MYKKFYDNVIKILNDKKLDDKSKIENVTRMLEPVASPNPKKPLGGDDIMERAIIKNASDYPKTYYFKHIEKGVAYYKSKDKMVLIDDKALRNMAPSLNNKPIYINHLSSAEDKVSNLEENMHGVIAESFYNKFDGWYWAKVVVFTDEANKLIEDGWSISNSYQVNLFDSTGGVYHGLNYDLSVKNGFYNHIALVPQGRYEGAAILTPSEYKEYNKKLELEIEKLENELPKQNKKERGKSMLKFFKKTKIENVDELVDAFVEIEGGNHVEISKCIIAYQNAEEEEEKKKEKEKEKKQMCNTDSIEVDGKNILVKDLVNAYINSEKKKNEKIKEEEEDKKKKKEDEEKIKNKAEEENKHFKNIKNAIEKGQHEIEEKKYDSLQNKLDRGKKY